MTVLISRDQLAWLEAQVAEGSLQSIEEGVRQAIAEFMTTADDDLIWAKSEVDAARRSVEAGRVIDGQAFLSELRSWASELESGRVPDTK